MIGLDTQILIWGVRGWSSPGQEAFVARTRRYIEYLAENNERIMVPTPVLAEYLTAFPPEEHDAQRAVFERNFYLPPLDVASAQLAAKLLYDTGSAKELRKEYDIDRQTLRTDALIIAIAVTHGASKIITHDARHFRRLAKAEIVVEDLPDIMDQKTLFE